MQRNYGNDSRPRSDDERFDDAATQRRIRENDPYGRETWAGSGCREWQLQANAMDRQSRRGADFGGDSQNWDHPRQLDELRSEHGQFGEGEDDESTRNRSRDFGARGPQYGRSSFGDSSSRSPYQQRHPQHGEYAPSQSGWQNRLMGDRWGRAEFPGGGDGYYAEMSNPRAPHQDYESKRYTGRYDSRPFAPPGGTGSVDTFGGYSGWSDRDAGNFRMNQPNRAGPKGYTRSDDRIRDDICECLFHNHELHVEDVSIEVSNGTVTMEGHVPDRRMKHRIEDLVEARIGVKDIDNRIRVRRQDTDWGSESNSTSSPKRSNTQNESTESTQTPQGSIGSWNGRSSNAGGTMTKN